MRHFDVQLIGGMVLHEGKIAEMKTGEGKTLVATLPCYLNALEGKGVHLVTVNDYLAKRDAAWMGPIYRLLGLSVGVIVHDLSDDERRSAYGCDLTYGTNNEFGFDYLRDNMKFDLKDYVQRPHHYAIVDEVDSILIDEARTPLIISGSSDEATDKYFRVDKVIPHLVEKEDYEVDEKHRQATPTDSGIAKAEKLLGLENLYDPANIEFNHHFQQALKAHTLFKLDRDYVVKDGEVIIVDEFTGRLMPGRRWSDGLHQAVEAKEGVKIESENQTLATVTFQNYFRMYKKLAGMTGHGGNGSGGIREDLQPGNRHRPHQSDPDPARIRRRGVPHRAGEIQRRDRGDQRVSPVRPAGAGGQHRHREIGALERGAEESRRGARPPARAGQGGGPGRSEAENLGGAPGASPQSGRWSG